MAGETAYLLLLFAVGFAFVFNLHLRGTMTQVFTVVLAMVSLALFALAFFLFSWKFAIVCIVLTLIFENMIIPVAAACASRLLGYRTGLGESDKHEALDRVMFGKISTWEYIQESEKEREQLRNKLARVAARGDVACVLAAHELSIDDFVDHYHLLGRCGLSDLAWEIIADPRELDLLIQMHRDGKLTEEIWTAFRRIA